MLLRSSVWLCNFLCKCMLKCDKDKRQARKKRRGGGGEGGGGIQSVPSFCCCCLASSWLFSKMASWEHWSVQPLKSPKYLNYEYKSCSAKARMFHLISLAYWQAFVAELAGYLFVLQLHSFRAWILVLGCFSTDGCSLLTNDFLKRTMDMWFTLK